MYIQIVPNRNSPPCILLREDHRENGRVVKKTLANLTKLPGHAVEGLRRLLKEGPEALSGNDFKITRTLPHGHAVAILKVMKDLDIPRLISSRRTPERNLIIALIAQRILNPQSKLATFRELIGPSKTTTLSEQIGLDETIGEYDIDKSLDWLLKRQHTIETKLADRHLKNGSLVFYDLTSAWYEGKHCPLAKRGYSRDGKRGKLQIEVGLLCDSEGRPVGVEVFEGNTADPMTVSSQIEKLRNRFGLERITVVGDRGMLTEASIDREIRKEEGWDWISALRGPAIRKLVEQEAFNPSLFDTQDMAVIKSPDYPGERLIVCRNPLITHERACKREKLLEATEKELERIRLAVNRTNRPLRGREAIALRTGKIINKFKVGKHFELTMGDDSFSYSRRQKKIEEEARLDGFYIIRTSVKTEELSDEKVVFAYKRLSNVEQAFRYIKLVDLKLRPVYHRLEDRVRAHVLVCMLAYYVEWEMRKRMAPILFKDEASAIEREKKKKSIVSPAEKSGKALAKASTKQTDDGELVHSFRTALNCLATICQNTIEFDCKESASFTRVTEPVNHQRVILNLLGVSM